MRLHTVSWFGPVIGMQLQVESVGGSAGSCLFRPCAHAHGRPPQRSGRAAGCCLADLSASSLFPQATAKEREGKLVEVDLKKLDVRRLRTALGRQVCMWLETARWTAHGCWGKGVTWDGCAKQGCAAGSELCTQRALHRDGEATS